MRSTIKFPLLVCVASATLLIFSINTAQAQFTPVWFDGYQSPATLDINAGIGPPRQGGSPVPLAYSANLGLGAGTIGADYHQQIIGDPNSVALLQLAGDAGIFSPGTAGQSFHSYASPNDSLDHVVGNQVYGRKISVTMDAFTNLRSSEFWDPSANGGAGGLDPNTNDGQFVNGFFTQAAITVGSSQQLGDADSNNKTSGFSVIFLEQTFDDDLANDPNVSPYFIQIRNAGDPPGDPTVNLFKNPAGEFAGNVEIFVNDPTDGNPWDGAGQTSFRVLVNGVQVTTFTQGGGGYTDNFITLDGSNQKNVTYNILATHSFDNLTVFSAAIPEPSSIVLIGMGICGLAARRRRVA